MYRRFHSPSNNDTNLKGREEVGGFGRRFKSKTFGDEAAVDFSHCDGTVSAVLLDGRKEGCPEEERGHRARNFARSHYIAELGKRMEETFTSCR